MKVKVIGLMLLGTLLVFSVTGCTGGSRAVESCSECNQSTTTGPEYCVLGELDQLYCANTCATHLDCQLDQWCVPLRDQGTWWANDNVKLRWVCMPERFYSSDKVVWRSWDDCNQQSTSCPSGMQCLTDDVSDPLHDIFFCSDPCSTSTECLSECCIADSHGAKYCAPYYPYCGS